MWSVVKNASHSSHCMLHAVCFMNTLLTSHGHVYSKLPRRRLSVRHQTDHAKMIAQHALKWQICATGTVTVLMGQMREASVVSWCFFFAFSEKLWAVWSVKFIQFSLVFHAGCAFYVIVVSLTNQMFEACVQWITEVVREDTFLLKWMLNNELLQKKASKQQTPKYGMHWMAVLLYHSISRSLTETQSKLATSGVLVADRDWKS